MARPSGRQDTDLSLAVRAAWLHYAGALTQAEVANRLGVTGVKAHRLIMRANQEGMVKVVIDGDIADCVRLESDLADTYGLSYCEVVPDLSEEPLPLRALGIAGSRFLSRAIERGDNALIGVGHGRTLAAAVRQLPKTPAGTVRFVSLLGGLTRNFSANPHDVMHRLAEKTGAEAYAMPVPFFANTAEDREVMLAQRGVGDVFNLAAGADPKVVGIGTVEPSMSLVETGMIEPGEMEDITRAGAVGELLGHFFDRHGRYVETPLTARTLSLDLDQLKNTRIVAIAGGTGKTCAIRSVLMSGLLGGLITDERTARALTITNPPAKGTNGRTN